MWFWSWFAIHEPRIRTALVVVCRLSTVLWSESHFVHRTFRTSVKLIKYDFKWVLGEVSFSSMSMYHSNTLQWGKVQIRARHLKQRGGCSRWFVRSRPFLAPPSFFPPHSRHNGAETTRESRSPLCCFLDRSTLSVVYKGQSRHRVKYPDLFEA